MPSPRDLASMRCAGHVVATILAELETKLQPGWTTADIDAYAERRVYELGARPAFKGYRGFPASTCTCINHEVVHGIPSPRRVIRGGDLVKVDFGAIVQGWYGDSCLTIGIEPLSQQARDVMRVAEQALAAGLSVVRAGAYLQAISGQIQDCIETQGYSVVRGYVGHGIGRSLHEPPQVPNFRTSQLPNPVLQAGMALAIEPIANAGSHETRVLGDRWTVVTTDGALSAQFEHTVLVTADGCEILTDRAGLP
ncbi:type I methionyl aminopeptidase [Synechococcus sp. PCC 7336]|uniref:type I methionyl aminopeptidase n=1 Tax=Synechococcus sp. PCC 7336 TaxID=195250 RepID=UPI001D0D1031|nr:type I methionyl aminopeptidase [Synechococcus sp. PCC 7336]